MKETRSASQILFGYLPEQTVDLRGGVWKVKDWRHPKVRSEIDSSALRREIIRQATVWAINGLDNGFIAHLKNGAPIRVLTLDESNGVEVEPFPRLWVCKRCNRIHDFPDAECHCGVKGQKGQLFFVGYHDKCGTIRAPWIPKCKKHRQVSVVFPGTASASEILFQCPVCKLVLRKGFGFAKCDCGEGVLTFQPHRATSVYTPRSVVIVNPPSKESIKTISEVGGPPKALSWVLDGMKSNNVEDMGVNRESLRRQLVAQGLPDDVVEKMLAAGDFDKCPDASTDLELSDVQREIAESEAVTIALATLESRVTLEEMISATESTSALGLLYRVNYRDAIADAGLEAVDLIERFPVLTGHFGYTRGDHQPGTGRLVPFKGRHGQGYKVYSEISETEALFVRLEPQRVAEWLCMQGHNIDCWDSAKAARAAILKAATPSPKSQDTLIASDSLLTLVHSYAHRFLRLTALHAGIDRNSLSELLVPTHLGFFLYAASKGDFVLGGLQAVFETGLNDLLDAIVYGEHRCALDPGCLYAGGACMACLHVGEPSCRHFNQHLCRSTLFGTDGYLRRL